MNIMTNKKVALVDVALLRCIFGEDADHFPDKAVKCLLKAVHDAKPTATKTEVVARAHAKFKKNR